MITTHQYDLFVAEGDDCFVITKAKVGSRFIEELFSHNCYIIPVDINLEFTTPESISKEAKDMFYRLNDKENNNKKIFILYRNPLNRFISGTVEDLINNISTVNYNEKFYLRKYCKQHNIEAYELFKELEKDEYDKSFLLEDKYKLLLSDLLSDFFHWQIQTTPVTSHHTSPYMAIYDVILKNENFNNENISLINLDDKENNLEEILSDYSKLETHDKEAASTYRKKISNKTFYPFVQAMLEKNQFFSNLQEQVTSIDDYFYQEFENSINNIKNEIRD